VRVTCARRSAKRQRFALAQAKQQQLLEANKENSFKLKGDIYGVDCRQFAGFFDVLTVEGSGSAESVAGGNGARAGARGAQGKAQAAQQQAELLGRLRALKEAQLLQRKTVADLDRVVLAHVTSHAHWFPNSSDGSSRFFRHDLANPYASDVEVLVTVRGRGVELVTNADEHAYCCKALGGPGRGSGAGEKDRGGCSSEEPAMRAPVPRRVQQAASGEPQSLVASPSGGRNRSLSGTERQRAPDDAAPELQYSLSIGRRRTLSVFLKYEGAAQRGVLGLAGRVPFAAHAAEDVRALHEPHWSRCKVSVHHKETLLEILQLLIRPQPMIPTRTFRVYLGQGERCSGLLPVASHEQGKAVRILSAAASRDSAGDPPVSVSADVVSKSKCLQSSDAVLRMAPVDSGSWLACAPVVAREGLAFGAVRLSLDAAGGSGGAHLVCPRVPVSGGGCAYSNRAALHSRDSSLRRPLALVHSRRSGQPCRRLVAPRLRAQESRTGQRWRQERGLRPAAERLLRGGRSAE
jgi:hypothetical protein